MDSKASGSGEFDWHEYLFAMSKPSRLRAFLEIRFKLGDREYWEFLSQLYVESEAIHQNIGAWKEFLSEKRPCSEFFMTLKDREVLKALPETFPIYRGYGRYKSGLSYTLSREMAEWFASRFAKSGEPAGNVRERTIAKTQVFAYLGARNEQEIVIHPRFLYERK